MKKADEINKDSKRVVRIITLAVIIMLTILIISYYIRPFNLLSCFNSETNMLVLLAIVPTVLFFLIFHELIHVALFIYYGKGEAKIKVSSEKKIGAIVIHQTNENVFYSRKEMLIIWLSPLVIINSLLIFIMLFIDIPFLIFWNIAMNTIGSSIDIYVSLYLITKFKSNTMVNFSKDSINMNIYTP